jgi:hypothetical protein
MLIILEEEEEFLEEVFLQQANLVALCLSPL